MIEKRKYLTLCLIGGMFGAHLFYAKKPVMGLLMALMTMAGIYYFFTSLSSFVVAIPALICLVDAYTTYTQSEEQFNTEIKKV